MGVGDSADSFAFDGNRVVKWHESSKPYGEEWAVGDIIGCHIDLIKKEISFYRNGRNLGVAFREVPVGEVLKMSFVRISHTFPQFP